MASRRLLDQNLETSNLRSRKHKYPLFFLTIHCLFLISILLCHIPAAQAQPYNNIKAKIEGDTTLFTIEVKDAELKDVLRALAKQNNLNIIVSEDITAKATFNFDRTNTIILRDMKKNIEDARLLIKSMDTRTMQVVIEARIIEVQTNFARDMGVQWGAAHGTTNRDNFTSAFGSTSTAPPSTSTPTGFIGSGGQFSSQPNYAVNVPASGTAGVLGALGLSFGKLSGDPLLLDLRISAGERNGKLKIVSQPKITTMNNNPATIHSGLTFKVKTTTTTTTTTATTTGTGLEEVKTGIDLAVTPQISADDFILLNIVASKSEPDFTRTVDGIPGVSEKKASTSVLVKDGETTVIGGLYKSTSSDSENAIPYLSRVPILGWLFKSTSKSSDNEELLVFITPRIVRYEKTNNSMEVRP